MREPILDDDPGDETGPPSCPVCRSLAVVPRPADGKVWCYPCGRAWAPDIGVALIPMEFLSP